MLLLIVGIIVFFAPHSIRIVSETGRTALIQRLGEGGYKGLYSILSFVGIALIGYGYGDARAVAPLVYVPPAGLQHLALLLVPLSLVAIVAAYAPAGRIKALLRHPMVVGVGLWALAHLIANGTAADLLLFGAFLVWAIFDFAASIRRQPKPAGSSGGWSRGDGIAIGIALVASAALLGGLHLRLFGVSPLS